MLIVVVIDVPSVRFLWNYHGIRDAAGWGYPPHQFTIMLETNGEWTVARRYMTLETLAHVNDNPNVRLPAVAS